MRAGNILQPVPINTLTFSADGQSIVIGRELGDLYRFDARTCLRFPPFSFPRFRSGTGGVSGVLT